MPILQAWGLGSLDWLTSPFGRRVTSSIVSIGVTLITSLILLEAANAVLERSLGRAIGGKVDALRRSARVRTWMPIIQRILFSVLALFVSLIALSEIGINIALLLAGAGVVGIAVGFGAQTLVKNFLTGMSIIMEDSMAVGDVVELGNKAGVVEQMSIGQRAAAHLRGHAAHDPLQRGRDRQQPDQGFLLRGDRPQHRLRGRCRPRDGDRARNLRCAAQGQRARPRSSAPISRLSASTASSIPAVVIKARIRTLPGKQWQVSRAFNRLLKMTFDHEGIETLFPQRVCSPDAAATPGRRRKTSRRPGTEPGTGPDPGRRQGSTVLPP